MGVLLAFLWLAGPGSAGRTGIAAAAISYPGLSGVNFTKRRL